MIDVLAAVAVLVGSALMALGAVGLLRFPDALTRMHAATKAATVGVIGITAAAAAEAGSADGIAVLVLVVALLFLSAPMGMTLLARAAYHDPETPTAPATRRIQLAPPVPRVEPTRRSAGASPFLALWLFGVWMAAFGSTRPNVIVGGVVVSALIALALRRLAPRWPHALLHPVAAIRFAGYFVTRLAIATASVAWALRLDPTRLSPAVIEVPLRVSTRNEVTLLMNAISFTPGTVALEVHDRALSVHVLTTDDPAAIAAEIRTMEDRIMAAFGNRRVDAMGDT